MIFDFEKLPKDANLASKIIDGHFKENEESNKNGKIGAFFGGSENISYNISGIIILICVVFLLPFIIYISGSKDFTYKDGVSSIASLITLFSGYMFGKSGKKE